MARPPLNFATTARPMGRRGPWRRAGGAGVLWQQGLAPGREPFYAGPEDVEGPTAPRPSPGLPADPGTPHPHSSSRSGGGRGLDSPSWRRRSSRRARQASRPRPWRGRPAPHPPRRRTGASDGVGAGSRAPNLAPPPCRRVGRPGESTVIGQEEVWTGTPSFPPLPLLRDPP